MGEVGVHTCWGQLTFLAEFLVVGAALAVRLTLGITVTLPASGKGLEAAALTGELCPEQNRMERVSADEFGPVCL